MSFNAAQGSAVILHIGLHKTGTRFLQREVFKQLDPEYFNYNPQPLWPILRQTVRNPGDLRLAIQAREVVDTWRRSRDYRTLILSEPHISGDMYSSHQDYLKNLILMQELFPEAQIIFFVRKHSDWLHSAYRQHLAKGKPASIEAFLNFRQGAFQSRKGRKINGIRNIEAMNLRFLEIYQAYAKGFGRGRVFLLRQEDLQQSHNKVKSLLAEVLGLEFLPSPSRVRRHNRSYSALAIYLFFPGVWRNKINKEAKEITKEAKPWWLKKVQNILRRLRRGFIQHVFDRLIYYDWDLLARHGMREQIEAHYAQENAELKRIARDILEGRIQSRQKNSQYSK